MVGVYDYTVVLTYFSLASAVTGIFVSLSGPGHPVLGSLFLLLCGLFDAFDGRVARRKKDRTELERQFGIQIDSLTTSSPSASCLRASVSHSCAIRR